MPNIAVAAAVSRLRISGVPCGVGSPLVRSKIPTRRPSFLNFKIAPAIPSSASSGCGAMTRMSSMVERSVVRGCKSGINDDSSDFKSEVSLAGLAELCQTSRPKFCRHLGDKTLSRRSFYLSCRLVALAAVATPLILLGGCTMMKFQKDFWSMDHYRDERAV